MKKEQFIESVQELLPGCGREAAQGWIDFAVENVKQEQYVNFKPEPDQEAAAEKWLETLYAGLSLTKREFGAEITGQIYGLSLSQGHCLYPWEMKGAAAFLQNGGDVDKVSELSVDGQFDGDAPFFPTLDNNPFFSTEPDRFRYYITGAAVFIGSFPHMEGMVVQESVELVSFENGAVNAFGFIDYPQPLTPEQEQDYCLIPASQNTNYLKTAEMGLEQNYNQIDGLINNQEPPHTAEKDRAERCPSILSQLKSDAARKDLPTAPQPVHKKDTPER